MRDNVCPSLDEPLLAESFDSLERADLVPRMIARLLESAVKNNLHAADIPLDN